jgi:hypothetical protein
MTKSPRLNSLLLLFSLTLFGCASFEPGIQYRDLSRNRVPTAAESQKGLDVSFEEFVSAKKSLLAFDADIAGNGIMALLINLDNKGGNVYRIPRSQLNASFDGEPLERLDGKEAATQGASKDYASRALGWTMATGPFALLLAPLTLTGSSAHTAEVNRTIEAHFAALELPDALLKKNQTISGFVYFKLPFGLTTLENAMLEIAPIDDQTGDKLFFKFALPAIGIELPPSRRERKTIDN